MGRKINEKEGRGGDFVGAFEVADEDARVGGCDAERSRDEGLQERRGGGGVVHYGGLVGGLAGRCVGEVKSAGGLGLGSASHGESLGCAVWGPGVRMGGGVLG